MADIKETKSEVKGKRPVAPDWFKNIAATLTPYIGKVGDLIDFLGPYISKARVMALDLWKKLEPYDPKDVLPMIFGLVLIFFGGFFVTTIACIEAFRLAGWEKIKIALTSLYGDFVIFLKASKDDDREDLDGDGVPDVQQISKEKLLTRKLKLFLTSCDPVKFSDALSGLYTGLVSVLATLRLQFARTITLGATIGDVLAKPTTRYLQPMLEAVVPKEYHKWIPLCIAYACRSVGVSIAWTLQRIVSTVHSALRGAQIFCDAFAHWTAKHGWLDLSKGYWDEVFVAVCALFGFYFQISSWFRLPWLMWFLLFPFVFVEKVLTAILAFAQ